MIKLKSKFKVLLTTGLLFISEAAFAADGEGFIGVIQRVKNLVGEAGDFVMVVAGFLGLVCAYCAGSTLMKLSDEARKNEVKPLNVIMYIVAMLFCFFLSYILYLAGESAFGNAEEAKSTTLEWKQ